MTVWFTTVLPALLHLAKEGVAHIFYVFEDTALLVQNVTYEDVSDKTSGVKAGKAGLFGYGYHTMDEHGKVQHFGSKGICATERWCHEMLAILQNTNFNEYKHFDLWLRARSKANQRPAIELCDPSPDIIPGCLCHQEKVLLCMVEGGCQA